MVCNHNGSGLSTQTSFRTTPVRGAEAPSRLLDARIVELLNLRESNGWSAVCQLALDPADRANFEESCNPSTGRPPLAAYASSRLTRQNDDPAALAALLDFKALHGVIPGLPRADAPFKVVTHYERDFFTLFRWDTSPTGGTPRPHQQPIGSVEGAEAPFTQCSHFPNLLGFFNGVANTRDSANLSLDRLQRELGPERNGTPLQYELFYNQTGCGSGTLGAAACLEDIFEVFAQRDRELQGVLADRWEIFWELLSGTHTQGSSLTGRLLGLLGGAGNALLQLIDTTFSAMLNQLVGVTGRLLTSPPTAANTAAHVARLQDHADQELGLVLVAHSQGNLFVNAAFDGLRAARPNAAAQVVHVAPASPTLRGDYTLADIDLVINGLRTTGVNSVPPANLTLPTNRSDLSGHMLEGTYLDTTRAAFARVKGMITTALDAL